MSVIQNIRTKYAKLAGAVIAIALVAFILMDALSSRTGNLFGNDTSVAKVNGEKIDYIDYNRRVQQYEVLYGSNQSLDENMRAQLRTQALQDLVKERLIMEEAEKIGLTLTEAEKKDMIYGQNPDPAVRNYQPFINPDTKMFDPQYVKLFEEQVDQLDPTGKAREHWENMKDYIIRNRIVRKYESLFANATYVPKYLVEQRAKEQAQMANLDFIVLGFDNVPDEEVKVTDKDIKEYMNRHKADFTIEEPYRTIEYVAFRVTPTAEDTARALGFLNTIKDDFASAKDEESFVNRNSEEPFNPAYRMKSAFRTMYADSIFNLAVGTVYGPYFENNTYKLSKVLDKKTYPDSVKSRHILIKTGERGNITLADSIAKQRMDSVVAAIKSGASFTEMVQKYSDDEGSKNTGGEYSFSFEQKNNLSKEFGDFIFDGKTGESKVVKVENNSYSGYHYIEILDQSGFAPALKVATVQKGLFAGDETETAVYGRASEFAGNNTTAAEFDKAVKEGSVQMQQADNIHINDYIIQGLGPARELIRWMYDAEVGDVSPVFPLDKVYVVAKLSGVKKEGMMELTEEMKTSLEGVVKQEKKADVVAKKYADKKSLKDIAAATGVEVQHQDSMRGNNSFAGAIGYAPKVIGYAFYDGLKPNTMSKPVKEQSGVYWINVNSRFSSPIDSTFITSERNMMQSELKNSMNYMITESIRKSADIEYNADNL